MYIPSPFSESDPGILKAFIDRNPFATVITSTESEPMASHIPIYYLEEDGKAFLVGHVAKANEHWRFLGRKSTAIFHGPHAYVSSRWYGSKNTAPTWNYIVVHVSGPLAHAGNRWEFNHFAVFTSKSNDFNMGRVLAHEFGHMLRLTRAQNAHTDDRGVATPWRHDLWSRMRMMSKYVNYDAADPDRHWQNLTYGVDNQNFMLAGDLISVKDLPNDGTDGELQRSRQSVSLRPHPTHGISPDA